MAVQWNADAFAYFVDGKEIDALRVKGASDAVSREAAANIRVLGDRLQGDIITLQEWYDSMKREVKILHMAEAALARGGIDQMTLADWERVEGIIAGQYNGVPGEFPGLRAFGIDIQKGRYGKTRLNEAFNRRASMYSNAGRATFENERLTAMVASLTREAKRVLAAADHCEDCVRWAALGWIPANEMLEKYPIASSVCGANCFCAIVTRRVKNQVLN